MFTILHYRTLKDFCKTYSLDYGWTRAKVFDLYPSLAFVEDFHMLLIGELELLVDLNMIPSDSLSNEMDIRRMIKVHIH